MPVFTFDIMDYPVTLSFQIGNNLVEFQTTIGNSHKIKNYMANCEQAYNVRNLLRGL